VNIASGGKGSIIDLNFSGRVASPTDLKALIVLNGEFIFELVKHG
jgi:hypothetical protein